jgi:hypothetical protein
MIFLAGRSHLRVRQLHNRIKNRLKTDTDFHTVTCKPAGLREPGPYRATAETDPRDFLDDDSYPAKNARLEIGFQIQTPEKYEYYWFNWIEPGRDFLLGWHQDRDHSSLGEVHIQVNDQTGPVDHKQATFINKHPLAVVEARLEQLPQALSAVQWDQSTGTISDFKW